MMMIRQRKFNEQIMDQHYKIRINDSSFLFEFEQKTNRLEYLYIESKISHIHISTPPLSKSIINNTRSSNVPTNKVQQQILQIFPIVLYHHRLPLKLLNH
jgi:hypothetical protein